MKKKGFTLIELLAVIVILGIITVIAVPKILDIINKSRESASNSSIKLIKDAIKTQVASSDLTGPVFTKETDGCYIFNFDDQTSGNTKSLEIKNKDKVSGSIKYCNNTFSDDTLKFDGKSINKDEEKGKIICKRASILHTEECTQTDSQYYCSGVGYTTSGTKGTSTITYGNLGTNGMLTSGDAFDCDVNGDGVYDSETERFYYVSDYYNTSTKSFENDTAVLIYYNNVSTGSPSNNTTYAYDSSGENFHGPRTAFAQLPTTSQWSNMSLKNTTRAILNENESNTTKGGVLPSNYSYEGYAARLLTLQEIRQATEINNMPTFKVGELDNFTYLMENTKFSSDSNSAWTWWLENARSDNSICAWYVNGYHRLVTNDIVSYAGLVGVRPVIEVSKKNIDY
ncbi:uncharacterized protein BN654_00737 [Clostridium sp. CAG:433]|nr:uncharacterized protein BN654_00737 [Clostridium sp. CAG:433]